MVSSHSDDRVDSGMSVVMGSSRSDDKEGLCMSIVNGVVAMATTGAIPIWV